VFYIDIYVDILFS